MVEEPTAVAVVVERVVCAQQLEQLAAVDLLNQQSLYLLRLTQFKLAAVVLAAAPREVLA